MLNLNDREWKAFPFSKIFNIKGGFYNKKPVADSKGNIPFAGATEANNGLTQFCSYNEIEKTSKTGDGNNANIDKKIFQGNCIAVTNNGSVGYAYYQAHAFTCSHDVNPLYLRNAKLNRSLALFLINSIQMQRVCFTYVRKWRPKRMKKSRMMLPINELGNPDYSFMEQYIKEREAQLIKRYENLLGKNNKVIEIKLDSSE